MTFCLMLVWFFFPINSAFSVLLLSVISLYLSAFPWNVILEGNLSYATKKKKSGKSLKRKTAYFFRKSIILICVEHDFIRMMQKLS